MTKKYKPMLFDTVKEAVYNDFMSWKAEPFGTKFICVAKYSGKIQPKNWSDVGGWLTRDQVDFSNPPPEPLILKWHNQELAVYGTYADGGVHELRVFLFTQNGNEVSLSNELQDYLLNDHAQDVPCGKTPDQKCRVVIEQTDLYEEIIKAFRKHNA